MPELQITHLRRGVAPFTEPPVLVISGLGVKLGIRRVIEDLTLEVRSGDVVCIAGPNGSGKSTLLNAVAGIDPARVEAGSIRLAGEDITGMAPHERARRGLAYLRQRENVFADLSVNDNLRIALGQGGPARFRAAYPQWGESLPGDKRAGLLSGGQRQRLAWAMTSLRPRQLLLIDEAEAGMDETPDLPVGTTCVLVTHSPERWLAEAS
jgi:ABC-type branched-subunit amino acid transport system ATPase component